MTRENESEAVRRLALYYIHEEQKKPVRAKARRIADTLVRPLNAVFRLLP